MLYGFRSDTRKYHSHRPSFVSGKAQYISSTSDIYTIYNNPVYRNGNNIVINIIVYGIRVKTIYVPVIFYDTNYDIQYPVVIDRVTGCT